MKSLALSLALRLEEGTAPITLIDAAVLSSIDSGETQSNFTAAFLLPSHHVWIAKRHYDQRRWQDSIRYAAEALKGAARLSSEGFVAACRYQCLSAARLGEQQIFDEGIVKLTSAAKTDWAKSNIAFLKGINLRFKGHLPQAENFFRESYALSPGNLHAARELAEICLARDNLNEAELFAREAHSHGPANPYLLDTLISVLVRKHGRSAKHVSEINDLFDLLERVGDQGGRSFFTTRKAEFEYLWGNNKEAARLVEDAISKTPTIFEPRRLHALIMLKDGNKAKAYETIKLMHEMVNARNPDERRTNFRAYLETNAQYLMETSRYREARDIYDDPSIFTDGERKKAVRDIEIAEAFAAERAKAK
jgi:tetratricopeptide (TPR) repeat protein